MLILPNKTAEGAYLFRSDIDYSQSQTMVGYVTGNTSTRNVDLNVNMTFDVTDPVVNKESEVIATTTVTESRDWSYGWERNYDYYQPTTPGGDDPGTPGEEPGTTPGGGDPGTPVMTPPATVIPEREVPLADTPEVDVLEVAVPLANVPEEDVELPEPDVPLANVPKTGDGSWGWLAVMMLSGAALAGFSGKNRKEEI